METERGEGRGSYIWGRSVHNTRIERLWYDVTHGFGQKWKTFFTDLEVHHGLNPRLATHIWLLHHLFLTAINTDAQEWAESWNSHNLQIRGERSRSPCDMFLFSMVQDGPRGLEYRAPTNENIDDPTTYGIDWQAADDSQLMDHHLRQNPQEWEERNPFSSGPDVHSHVPCEPPNSPFSHDQIALLDQQLSLVVNVHSRTMGVRHRVWVEALRICNEFYQ
ncbi:hypothetical protein FB45DRAFT_739035 [Roridomyces roridus]|uniref:Integrase core domain-containing protein n=1 Tax=Roridomyces roridus TaxID=1738132 RepID=A0AAD7C7I4_9AGAR|nr:hypothetical protein FB45DRAFT_739035 [Roridomyces roridus]